MNPSIEKYIGHRETLLQAIVEKLSPDERFVAAWLTGSFGRGKQDPLSDIDLTLVVADEYCQTLCTRPKMVNAQTTQERYALFGLFGRPALIHENHLHAPEGGTFSFVAYAQTAVMVDWVLRPLTGAQRSGETHLLFDKVGIPVQPPVEPVSQEQRAEEASEIMAFFWMMTAVTIKYVYRGDGVFVNTWLDELTKLIYEVERRVAGQVWAYHRGSYGTLKMTPDEQIGAIHQLCKQMENLMPEVAKLGGYVHDDPMVTIEILIGIAQPTLWDEESL